jgi:hypothetical protein
MFSLVCGNPEILSLKDVLSLMPDASVSDVEVFTEVASLKSGIIMMIMLMS